MMTDEVIQGFKDCWVGTDEQLEQALEDFYTDVRGSFELALTTAKLDHMAVKQVLITVDDYVGNHYF